MKLVIFEAKLRDASAFDCLKPTDDVLLVAEPLRAGKADSFADAELVSTFILAAFHVAAVLFHHFILRDQTPLKMLPRRSSID
jgi:hypothetical protein